MFTCIVPVITYLRLDFTVNHTLTELESKSMLIPNRDQSVTDLNMDAEITGVNDRNKKGKNKILHVLSFFVSFLNFL